MKQTNSVSARIVIKPSADTKRKFKSATSLWGLSMNEATVLFAEKFIQCPEATLKFIRN